MCGSKVTLYSFLCCACLFTTMRNVLYTINTLFTVKIIKCYSYLMVTFLTNFHNLFVSSKTKFKIQSAWNKHDILLWYFHSRVFITISKIFQTFNTLFKVRNLFTNGSLAVKKRKISQFLFKKKMSINGTKMRCSLFYVVHD